MAPIEDQARSIFLAALERTPDQWPAFLDETCGANAELRARADQLLQAHQALGSIHGGAASDQVPTIGLPVVESPGTVIGSYKLLEQIGEGGFGAVYLAEQTEPVRRKVALKILKSGMDSRQVVARFEAERQALAIMDHPNIAKVFDGGATPSGRPYFVMELVKGIPITGFCDQNHLTPRQRLELFVPVCQAVQHAHQKGIIHRDLKPSNVLVSRQDTSPIVKVIDFGIAKALGQELTDKTLFTGIAQMVGTPLYMSPEQAGMSDLDVDTRSDIYSLGVLLYELLTGTTPFNKERFKKAAYDEIRRIIREEDPPKPSTRLSNLSSPLAPQEESKSSLASVAARRHTEPAKLTKLVRGELDWIVMKALEKDRTRRYETANGFAADVQRYLADEAVLACPPSAGYRLRKFVRRNKGGLAVAVLVLFFLMVLGSGIGWAVRDRSAREAEAARQQGERYAKAADQVASIFAEVDRLEKEQKWPEALAAARRAEAAVAGGEADAETAERVRQRLKGLGFIDRLEQIRIQQLGAGDETDREYARAFHEYGVDVDNLPVEASIERLKARPALAIPLAASLGDWIYHRRYVVMGQIGWVIRADKTAVLERAVTEEDAAGWKRLVAVARGIDPHPLRDRLRSTWGWQDSKVKDELRRLASSIDVRAQHPTTLYILAKTLGRMRDWDSATQLLQDAQYVYPGDFDITIELGMALNIKQDYEGALRYYTAAVSIRPHSAFAHALLGQALRRLGKVVEAIAAFRKSIEVDPKANLVHKELGDVLRDQGKLDEAVAVYREYVEAFPEWPETYNHLGGALRDQKKLNEANAEFAKAIEIIRKRIELSPQGQGAANYNDLGNALANQNKLDEAIDVYRKAVAIDPNYARSHFNLGNALSKKKKGPEAIDAYRKAVALDPKYANAYFNLGNALLSQNKLPEAADAYLKAIEIDPEDGGYHFNLGIALFNLKNWPEAVDAFRRVIKLNPKNADAYSNLGAALFHQGKLDEAIAAYRKVIELDPKSKRAADASFKIGKVLESQGKLGETIACFQKAVELDPQFAAAHNALAWLLTNCREAELRDPQRGLEVARKAVELARQSSFAWQMLGWAHYRAGDWMASIEALEKSCALQDNPKGGDACQWFFSAMAHWQRGEKDKARELYDRAVQWMDKNEPKNEDLRRFRGEAAELLGLKEKK